MTHTATYRRDDLGPRSADVTEHHRIVIRYDSDGYTRIHEDALGPLLRAADYQLEQPHPLRIEGTWLAEEVDGCNCNGGDAASNGAHEPYCGTEPVANLATLPGYGELAENLANCDHVSLTGVDRTSDRMRCDHCGRIDPPGTTDKAAALRSAPLANEPREHDGFCTDSADHPGDCVPF